MATTGRTSVISFGDAISGGGASGGEVIAHLNATPELKGVGRRGRALQRDPVVVNLNDAGVTMRRKGQVDAAIKLFQEALQIDSDAGYVMVEIGVAFAMKGLTDEALMYLEDALRVDPKDKNAHFHLGTVLRKTGSNRSMEAVFHLSEAVRLDPKFGAAHNNLGEAFRNRGELEPAVKSFEAAIALNKGFKQAHNNLGLCYRMRGGDLGKDGASDDEVARQSAVDASLAQRCFTEAVAIDPAYKEARFNLAQSCAERGRPEEACKQLREVLSLDAKFGGARELLEDLEKHVNALKVHTREAERSSAKVGKSKASNKRRDLEEGQKMMDIGDFTHALVHYSNVLRVEPTNVEAHTHIGVIHKLQGNIEQALVHWNTITSVSEACPRAHEYLGDWEQGKNSEDGELAAIRHFEAAQRQENKSKHCVNQLLAGKLRGLKMKLAGGGRRSIATPEQSAAAMGSMTVTSKVVSRRTPEQIVMLKEEQSKSRKSGQQELLTKLSVQKTNLSAELTGKDAAAEKAWLKEKGKLETKQQEELDQLTKNDGNSQRGVVQARHTREVQAAQAQAESRATQTKSRMLRDLARLDQQIIEVQTQMEQNLSSTQMIINSPVNPLQSQKQQGQKIGKLTDYKPSVTSVKFGAGGQGGAPDEEVAAAAPPAPAAVAPPVVPALGGKK